MNMTPGQAMSRNLGDKVPVAPIVERTISGLYLASDEAQWVTGTNIVVDGGASAIM